MKSWWRGTIEDNEAMVWKKGQPRGLNSDFLAVSL